MNFHQRVHKVEANLCKVAEAECKERLEDCKAVHGKHKVEAKLNKVGMPVLAVLPEKPSNLNMIYQKQRK